MCSPTAFREEQEKLGNVWNFIGYESDIPNVNDWFRTTLGARSIFVQRFKQGIRGFENVCAHRFHPIRIDDRGSGPVVCGFHHWRYDADGLAVGIPKCEHVYGKSPREMDARLLPVEVAVCGGLIFARLGGGPSLEEWLGPGFGILEHLMANLSAGHEIDLAVRSHWKPLMAVSLDDYHSVAVHPGTFGKDGYLDNEQTIYYRFGAHSAFFYKDDADALETMARDCREQNFTPDRYRIFQFFPTLLVATIHARKIVGDDYWYLLIQHLKPQEHDRTNATTRFFPMPFVRPAGFLRRIVRCLVQPFVNIGFRYVARQIHVEDNRICENIQSTCTQISANPILSRQEQRIEWFEEEYSRYVTALEVPEQEFPPLPNPLPPGERG